MEIGAEQCRQRAVLALQQLSVHDGPKPEERRSSQSQAEKNVGFLPQPSLVFVQPRRHGGLSGGKHTITNRLNPAAEFQDLVSSSFSTRF